MRLARFAAAVVIVGSTPVASADPHPMSSGANPKPTTETQVAMTAETLTIDMELEAAAVAAAVTLENKGPATKLVVGFPCAIGEDAGQVDVPCKVPITVTAGGKKMKLTKKKADKQSANWQWTLRLAANQRVELVVRYRAPLINDRYTIPAQGMGIFTYRLTTGAAWVGPIGKLDITLNHMHEALLYIAPAGYKREPGRITWNLVDHEPTEEVVIMPHPRAGSALAMKVGGKTAAEYRQRLDAGDYEKAQVAQAVEMLGDKREFRDDWPALISKLGGVPAPAADRVDAVVAESVKMLEDIATRAKR